MKRRFQGLASTAQAIAEVTDGVFLVRVEQVASFIKHLAEFAARDREELLVKLNSFNREAGAA